MSGPIVDPHGMLLRDTNSCTGTPAVVAQRARSSAAVSAVGGVALVGVDLDRRAVVDERGVVGVVALGVVRVHGVGVVGRDAARARRAARWSVVDADAAGGEQTLDAPSRGAARRRRSCDAEPTSSWSNSAIDGDVVAGLGGGERATVAAQHDTWLSRRPLASSERSAPSTAAGCTSYRHSSHARRRRRSPGPLGEPRRRSRRRRVDVAHTGRQVGLAVEHQPALVDVAVEVDRQLRHPGDRLGDVDERRRAVGGDDPAGDAEVAVEPAVEQHAAVDLDAELPPAGAPAVGPRLDAQAGRVGVGADDADRPTVTVAGRRQATSAPPRRTNPAPATSLHESASSTSANPAAGEPPGGLVGGVPRRR